MRRRRRARAHDPAEQHRKELSDDDARIIAAAHPYTMTGFERRYVLLQAVEYVERRRIPGAYAECGVWRGGSVLTIVLKLLDLGVRDRDLYLYDTFGGMTAPTVRDTSRYDRPALDVWHEARSRGEQPWTELFDDDRVTLDRVRDLLYETGYPEKRFHFVPGPVEETIPDVAPDELALLRLDTDWYQSTRHELVHLYPRLSPAGVLVVDDYGHWDGCRRAVDEYFDSEAPPVLLNRVDYACRIAVKA